MAVACETCRELLSEGLDLCVRARQMDAQERTKCATLHLWVIDQYEKDLAAWERKGRSHLMGCVYG